MLYNFFNLITSFYTVLLTVSYMCMFYLSDRVDDVMFEGNQERVFEEEPHQFDEEGKWPSPSVYSFLSY